MCDHVARVEVSSVILLLNRVVGVLTCCSVSSHYLFDFVSANVQLRIRPELSSFSQEYINYRVC